MMSIRAMTARTACAAGAVAVGVLATACSSLSGSGSGTTPSPSAAAPSSAVSNSPSSTSPGGAAPVAGGPDAPSPTDCQTANLRVGLGSAEGAAGHTILPIQFTNVGKQNCTMVAWPGVSYVAGDDGHQVGQAAQRVGDRGSVVTLKPGAVASAELDEVHVETYDASQCQITQVRGLRIYPPHNTASVFVAQQDAKACASTAIPGYQLGVQSVKPGPGTQ